MRQEVPVKRREWALLLCPLPAVWKEAVPLCGVAVTQEKRVGVSPNCDRSVTLSEWPFTTRFCEVTNHEIAAK